MATYEIVALVTDEAKRQILLSLAKSVTAAVGCVGVTHFSVGSQGHDPADPVNALTPDVTMTDPPDQVIFPPMPINSTIIDESSEISPTFQLIIPAGIATGIVSSIYLWATIFNDAEVEAELNAGGFTSIVPPPSPYHALNYKVGVPRYEDLPTVGNSFGDARNVALSNLDYYWNGQTWKIIRQRFLFGIANTPRVIKFDSQQDEHRVTLQM